MLGKKKKHRVSKIDSLVGQNTEIQGNLTFVGGLHVDGCIKGNVLATEGSDSTMTLSENGRIEGEVHVPYIVLNGEVQGDVYASEKIELAPRARIRGDVYYNLLEMAMGAEVNGSLVHRQDLASNAARKDKIKADVEPKLQTAD